MSASSLRHRLRAETGPAHAALDRFWAGADLAARASYGGFLHANAAALLPLEAALEAAGIATLLPDWPARRRTDALAADLAGLGLALPGAERLTLAPDIGLLGVAYVLEGSRLGGAMLLRAAGDSTDALVRANRRYLAHGAGAQLWPSFVAQLDSHALSEPQQRHVIASANQTFERFHRCAIRAQAARLPA